jgi:hypothetical protein
MFVFAGAVLQIEHRIALRALLIIRRCVDEGLQHRLRDLRKIVDFAQLAVWNVLQRIEILIVGRNLNGAAPAARTVEDLRARVRDGDAVNVELVIMKTFVLSVCDAGPDAVLSFGHRIANAAHIDQHSLSVRRPQLCADAPLRVDLGILFARLVQ